MSHTIDTSSGHEKLELMRRFHDPELQKNGIPVKVTVKIISVDVTRHYYAKLRITTTGDFMITDSTGAMGFHDGKSIDEPNLVVFANGTIPQSGYGPYAVRSWQFIVT